MECGWHFNFQESNPNKPAIDMYLRVSLGSNNTLRFRHAMNVIAIPAENQTAIALANDCEEEGATKHIAIACL